MNSLKKEEKFEKFYFGPYQKAKQGGFYKFFQKLIHPKLYFAAQLTDQLSVSQKMAVQLENLPIAVQIYEGERLIYANRKCMEAFGAASKEELLCFNFLEKVKCGESAEMSINFDEKLGGRLKRKGSAEFLLESRVVESEGRQYRIIYAVEITGLKEKIKESEARAAELEKESSFLKSFIGVLAHDLRNFVNVALGMSEMLAEEIENMSFEMVEKFGKTIHSEVRKINDLLEELLEWYKLQNGKGNRVNKTAVAVLPVVERAAERYKGNEKKIRFQTNISPEIKINVDEEMFSTIIRNLISNAVKFSNYEGVVRIDAEKKDGKVSIRIADNGIGMTKKRLEEVFGNDGETVKSTKGTDGEKGAGIGIRFVKEMVAANDGTISASSELLRGTTVTLTFQAADEEKDL